MKLGLGTVQFGLDYGIANSAGRPPEAEVKRILERAASVGMTVLDTAAAYGDSESVLGKLLDADQSFKIVTKVPRAAAVKPTFAESLRRLHRTSIYGLLLHDADDLVGPDGDSRFAELAQLRNEGKVQRIGASTYTPEQVDAIITRFPIDLIQVPVNVFDQRLISGDHLARLKAKGIEVHARSSYLQGLLLMEPAQLAPYFAPIRPKLQAFQEAARSAGLTPLQAALGFVLHQPHVDNVLVGVNSVVELEPALAATKLDSVLPDASHFAVNDPAFVNPALWPARSG